MLKFYQLSPAAGGKPAHVAIILHGLGDSGRGMIPIGTMWRPDLPDTEFLCPDAPFPFDMAPPEMTDGGRQWFSLRQLAVPIMRAGVQEAAPYLDDFIDNILESRALPAEKLALVGFSQGAMMALYVAPRRDRQLAGVIGYSGVLTGGETLAAEKKSAPPVLLIHGTADEVVPYALFAPGTEALKNAGIPVTAITRPGLGHGIDDAGLAEGLKFLKKILT